MNLLLEQSGPGLDGSDTALMKAIQENEVDEIIQSQADEKTH